MNDLMESKHTNFPVERNYALILFRRHGSIPRGLLFASQSRSVLRTNKSEISRLKKAIFMFRNL